MNEPTPISLEDLLARLDGVAPQRYERVEGGTICSLDESADRAAHLYAEAIGEHAHKEQLAVFWSEFPEAKAHREALDFIQKRGIEECVAVPFRKGAW